MLAGLSCFLRGMKVGLFEHGQDEGSARQRQIDSQSWCQACRGELLTGPQQHPWRHRGTCQEISRETGGWGWGDRRQDGAMKIPTEEVTTVAGLRRATQKEFQLWTGCKRPHPVRSGTWLGHAYGKWGNSAVARVEHGQHLQRATETGLCLLSFCETG